ncbi:hypothetical protein AO367_0813 [Moraxella catarrhalis]|uniref:Uncharacterized protein n=1 Tax=Moraxella catarrhalis TaxID=480 RepID=A0AB36DLJ5_MORCA|nr:hypothetical protein AO380_0174 [Moraxella catarrhalis]OAV22856.1 hypothetical protein AO370_1866 [Moraxella catarrhalis]OAV31533.1 hypothetical protein AO367_0813 [Moraxella catarrhalis]
MPSCNANPPFDSSVIKASLQNPWHQILVFILVWQYTYLSK